MADDLSGGGVAGRLPWDTASNLQTANALDLLADLNSDGRLNVADMDAFLNGERPPSTPTFTGSKKVKRVGANQR